MGALSVCDRRFVGLVILVGATLGLSDACWAQSDNAVVDRVVFPTGQFPTDVVNVQAAVDLGGTVLLKATNTSGQPTAFNFGTEISPDRRGVDVETDVTILGEQAGSEMTRIRGGVFPFNGVAPVRTRIEGIHFDGPAGTAILVTRSTGSDIVGNRVSNVVGRLLTSGLTEGRGIKFLGGLDPDGAITGHVRVVGNVIEDLHADLSDAILFDAVAADIEITGNHIQTAESGGIVVSNSKGLVSIEGNVIVPGPGGLFGNGIVIVDRRAASYVLRRNTIVCENPQADGILLIGFGPEIESPLIEKNQIVMQDSLFGAVTLVSFGGSISNAYVGGNRISGTGAFALDTFGFPHLVQSSTFLGNDISRFDASVADVFLDALTQDTVLVGRSGTVIDLGVNNRITGFTNMGGANVGKQIRDAIAAKHEAISMTLK